MMKNIVKHVIKSILELVKSVTRKMKLLSVKSITKFIAKHVLNKKKLKLKKKKN